MLHSCRLLIAWLALDIFDSGSGVNQIPGIALQDFKLRVKCRNYSLFMPRSGTQ